jgi:hypothetical protein
VEEAPKGILNADTCLVACFDWPGWALPVIRPFQSLPVARHVQEEDAKFHVPCLGRRGSQVSCSLCVFVVNVEFLKWGPKILTHV